METKKRIVEIRPVEGAPVYKGVNSYSAPIIYVLEDGQEIGSRYRRKRRRDVEAYVASLPAAPKYPLFACFDKDGNFYSTEEHIGLGMEADSR
jgi:hypothetical protein